MRSERHSNDSRVHGDNVLFVCPSGLDRDLYVSALQEAGFATTIAETPAAATKWLEEAAVLDVLVVPAAGTGRRVGPDLGLNLGNLR